MLVSVHFRVRRLELCFPAQRTRDFRFQTHKGYRVKTEMAQKRLEDFSRKEALYAKEEKAEPRIAVITGSVANEKGKRFSFPPVAPQNLSASYIVSATYDGKAERP